MVTVMRFSASAPTWADASPAPRAQARNVVTVLDSPPPLTEAHRRAERAERRAERAERREGRGRGLLLGGLKPHVFQVPPLSVTSFVFRYWEG